MMSQLRFYRATKSLYATAGVTVATDRGGGRRSGTMGGSSPGCFSWVLLTRSITKPDQHRKDTIQQESLGTDML